MHHWLAAQARSWLGTRFAHQGRQKRQGSDKGGVDCLGLLIGVARELDIHIHDPATNAICRIAVLDNRHYGHRPDGRALHSQLSQYLTPCNERQPWQEGNIVLFAWDSNPQHLGIVSHMQRGGWGVIHAYAAARQVVEHRLDAQWQGRMVERFRVL